MPHIALFAVRNIKLNEELTFDYKISGKITKYLLFINFDPNFSSRHNRCGGKHSKRSKHSKGFYH